MLTAHFFFISSRFAYPMLSFSSSQCTKAPKINTNMQDQNRVWNLHPWRYSLTLEEVLRNLSGADPVFDRRLDGGGSHLVSASIFRILLAFFTCFLAGSPRHVLVVSTGLCLLPMISQLKKASFFFQFPCCSDKVSIFP